MRRVNTKALIWFGRNDARQSRLSCKVYLVAVRGKRLFAKWGAADLKGRKVHALYLNGKNWKYESHDDAAVALEATVENKLRKGYELAPRGISRGLTAF